MVKEIKSDHELQEELVAAHGKLVVIDFFATWCGPCVKIAPFIAQLADTYQSVVFLKIDVDGDAIQESVQKYQINCMPTFVFLKNDAQVDRLEGASEEELRNMVCKHTC